MPIARPTLMPSLRALAAAVALLAAVVSVTIRPPRPAGTAPARAGH
jgi:hypothetical protein